MSGDGRPEVTVSNPAAPRPGEDLLGADDDEPRSSRRPLLIVVAAVLVLGAVTGVTNVRERRAAEAVERDLAATAQLALEAFDGSLGGSSDGDSARLGFQLGLRNTGPRELTVLRARLGDFATERESDVAPGGLRSLALQVDLDCRRAPSPVSAQGPLMVDVRTGDGVERLLDLGPVLVGLDAAESRRLCGYLTPGEALGLFAQRWTLVADELRLGLNMFNQGRTPLGVQDVTVVDGLSLRLAPGALPAVLAPRVGGAEPVELQVEAVLRIERCSPELLGQLADQGLLAVSVTGEQAGDPTDVRFTPDGFSQLRDRVCP